MKNTQELLHDSKELIKRHIPRALGVNVIIQNVAKGRYVAKIKVRSKGKTLWAQKLGKSASDTVSKAISAILKQHQKKNRRRSSLPLVDLSMSY